MKIAFKQTTNNLPKQVSTTQKAQKVPTDWKNISVQDGIRQELKDPLGLINLAMCLGSRITSEAIPAFKEEGVVSGIKATGKSIVAGFASYFGDVGFSVAFRKLGATVGTAIAGGAGAAVGSFFGNLAGGIVSNAIVQKIFPYKEKTADLSENSNGTSETSENKKSTGEDEEELSLDEKVAKEREKESATSTANMVKATSSEKAKNPYNSKIEYVTEDGITIYEKPNINMKTYLANNPDKIPFRKSSSVSKCNFLA